MIFASFLSDGLYYFVLVFALVNWSGRKLLREHDKDGAVRGAAKDGIVRLIGRWLK